MCLDPGIGFGKTVEHNLELVRRLHVLTAIGRPVVVGFSASARWAACSAIPRRRSGRSRRAWPRPSRAYERGATILRVHDVREHVEALTVARAVTA